MLVEVLSRRTEEYDRGEKREHYERIASLREYVLVAQERRRVEVVRREEGSAWVLDVLGSGDAVFLRSIDVAFSVDELYESAGL